MARPEATIDLIELEKLCSMQCTDEEIAAFFGVSSRTIERRRKVERFREIMDNAKAKGRISVRRNLFRLSANGNSAVCALAYFCCCNGNARLGVAAVVTAVFRHVKDLACGCTTVGYVFERADYPWVQYWGFYPPTQKMARGMEFSTQPFDLPRREVVTTGRMFDTPLYRWLPAKSRIRTRFLLFYARIPEGFNKVDDVRIENGQIIIVNRSLKEPVRLASVDGL